MKTRLLSALALVAYSALLVKVMVFKDIPTILVGQLMLNFGGADAGHAPNFVPFVTIVPYLLGYKGWIIAGINLVGNVVLLVPLGFLIPLVCPNITWNKALGLAGASGLAIEILQTVLRVGIFDIDDVILNALGFIVGYFAFKFLTKWMRERKYIQIVISTIIVIAAAASAFYYVYPWGQPVNPGVGAGGVQSDGEGAVPQTGDLCGGTGGTGKISSVGSNSLTLTQKNGTNLIVTLTAKAAINTPTGPGSISDLKIGDSVTLVGDANHDGTFTADAVFVCS